MTSLPAKVTAVEKRGDQYQVIVQISTKYRGSFNTLAFREGLLEEMTKTKQPIEQLREMAVEPCLSVGDATTEAMAVVMSHQIGEALACISSEGRGIVDVVCGTTRTVDNQPSAYSKASRAGARLGRCLRRSGRSFGDRRLPYEGETKRFRAAYLRHLS
jgi:hypothetical protein